MSNIKLHKSKQQENIKTQQLTVVVRIRPLFEDELHKGAFQIVRKADEKMVVLQDPNAGHPVDILRAKRARDRKYIFDWAFDRNSSQEEVYDKTTKSLVENVVEGYNGTVFAYGATGSGKTYTMVGEDENPGIMVRALKDLFKEVDREHKMYDVSMSYLEIYNENIRDLLNPGPASLELREDAKGNHQVAGLSEMDISSSEEVMSLLTRGNRRRTQEATGANKTSSRSHAVLLVQVRRKSNQQQTLRTGKLFMVDLAGSERAAQTQNTGKRLVEGAHINKSLLALGNCINALAERSARYVNFRDSKLTRILKEPLSGNCKTVMVSHVSPSHLHFEESRNTLVYADRAKNITTKLKSNVSDVSYHVAQYQTIINELRQEIDSLQRKVQDSKSSTPTDSASKDEKRLSDEEMQHLKKRLVESFNTQMDVRRRMMEIDNYLLAQSIEFDKLGMIMSEWETEKAVSALDSSQGERRGSFPQNHEKELPSENVPDYVRQAWEDLQFHRNQHQRYLQMREDCENDYMECKARTHKATESLPEKASSREQRELLTLLTRVHELEVEKLEMQASQLVREHELRCRDLMILRYDRQRQLCDEIITKQRRLINAMAASGKPKDANARKELNELYHIYQQEIQELSNGRDSDLGQLSFYSNPYRPSSSGGLRPLGSSGSMLELHHLHGKMPDGSPLGHPLPAIPLQSENRDPERQLFQRRRRIPFHDRSTNSSDSDQRSRQLPPLASMVAADVGRGNRGHDAPRSGNAPGRRSMTISSSSEYTPTSSVNGRSSDSSENHPLRKRLGEVEEPYKKRFGLLPSLKPNKKHGTNSDVHAYRFKPPDSQMNVKKLPPDDHKHKIAEERRTKFWGNGKNFRF